MGNPFTVLVSLMLFFACMRDALYLHVRLGFCPAPGCGVHQHKGRGDGAPRCAQGEGQPQVGDASYYQTKPV